MEIDVTGSLSLSAVSAPGPTAKSILSALLQQSAPSAGNKDFKKKSKKRNKDFIEQGGEDLWCARM